MLRNHRHELFAQGIAKGKPLTTAYKAAGYRAKGRSAESNASRLLRNAEVSKRLDELAAELKAHAVADAREVQEFLSSVMRGEVSEDLLTRDGFLVTAKPQVKERVRAAELLGRAHGLFSLQVSDSEGELLAIAQALAAARPPPN